MPDMVNLPPVCTIKLVVELLVKFLTVAFVPLVTTGKLVIPLEGIVASRSVVGTTAGLQLSVIFQFELIAPVQVTGAIAKPGIGFTAGVAPGVS